MNTNNALSHDEAMVIVDAIRMRLETDGLGAAVAVCDDHGELIAFLRTDGCRLPSIHIAQNKAYTAAREQVPSKVVGERSRDEGFPMTNFGSLEYVSWGGGYPIERDGSVVGGVGVSGLPEATDMELARLGMAALENSRATA